MPGLVLRLPDVGDASRFAGVIPIGSRLVFGRGIEYRGVCRRQSTRRSGVQFGELGFAAAVGSGRQPL